ncbi:MAG: ParB/RepB/Spo0J family partition protein [Candidatus Yonathbacteria bacterium]|nr:ParB/RepB/Spo0J family partition protein [Candidatus Yonathbacteria bacterium]
MSQTPYFENAIFYIEVEKIKPNPYQPRREFDEGALRELADSIRMYGVLQPLVVTRREFAKEDGGMGVDYELIAGERRLRASKLAGLLQVPAVIRVMEDDSRMKLELAIIENLQREDLNPVDRAVAFRKLMDEFGFKHIEIAKKVGKSREYVSNTVRLLSLPQEVLDAISTGKISEGHTRPLLMLGDRPEEQMTLFKEITFKKMSVREAEGIARRIAYDRVRKHTLDPEMVEMEEKLTEALGTRVRIDRRDVGGKITIDFFSNDDIRFILDALHLKGNGAARFLAGAVPIAALPKDERVERTEELVAQASEHGDAPVAETVPDIEPVTVVSVSVPLTGMPVPQEIPENLPYEMEGEPTAPIDDRSKDEVMRDETEEITEQVPAVVPPAEEEDLYSVRNFSL